MDILAEAHFRSSLGPPDHGTGPRALLARLALAGNLKVSVPWETYFLEQASRDSGVSVCLKPPPGREGVPGAQRA